MIVTVHFLWRPVNYTSPPTLQTDRTDTQTDRQTDRQRSDSIGQTVLQTVARKQLIAEYDMTYVSQLGFPTTVPPRQSYLTFVANHSTTLTTTHFRYLLLHWLLVAVFLL